VHWAGQAAPCRGRNGAAALTGCRRRLVMGSGVPARREGGNGSGTHQEWGVAVEAARDGSSRSSRASPRVDGGLLGDEGSRWLGARWRETLGSPAGKTALTPEGNRRRCSAGVLSGLGPRTGERKASAFSSVGPRRVVRRRRRGCRRQVAMVRPPSVGGLRVAPILRVTGCKCSLEGAAPACSGRRRERC
jgi:hypothetical protein